jgi:Domain of unknown function (DUF3786)
VDKPAPIFDQIYQDYLKQLRELDLTSLAPKIGTATGGGSLFIPLFGRPYQVSPSGVSDPSGQEPIHSVKVVLCRYLLHYPSSEPQGQEWVSYKDFKGAAPFVGGFQNNTERAIAKKFSGRLTALKEACHCLGGEEAGGDWTYQLSMKFTALPHIPILLAFNDADEEFPALCLLLFERRAGRYLDMECLAILAWLLTDYVNECRGEPGQTVM